MIDVAGQKVNHDSLSLFEVSNLIRARLLTDNICILKIPDPLIKFPDLHELIIEAGSSFSFGALPECYLATRLKILQAGPAVKSVYITLVTTLGPQPLQTLCELAFWKQTRKNRADILLYH